MQRSRRVVGSALALSLAALLPAAQAAPGDLDRSFSGDGVVTTSIAPGSGLDIAYDVAVQPDGKVVAAGFGQVGLNRRRAFAVVRYNANGTLDHTFGGDGIVTTAIIGDSDEARSVALQPDGKVVVGGTAGSDDFALARYRPDGSLDPTFGTNGVVTTDFAVAGLFSEDLILSMALQPDGRIVAGGTAGDTNGDNHPDFALARYLPDGSLDASFDGDGKVTTSFTGIGQEDVAMGLALQPDGRIVAAGYSFLGNPCGQDCFDWHLVRYRSDGSLDPSFDGDGRLSTDFGSGNELPTEVSVQSDGRIVAAGTHFLRLPVQGGTLDDHSFALARYHTDGSLDAGFGAGGKVITDAPFNLNRAEGLLVQPDGRIVAVGSSGSDLAVARYQPDGTLDPSFSTDGIATTDVEGADALHAVALQRDGSIVVAGTSNASGLRDFAVARYEANLCPGIAIDNTVVGTPGDDVLTGTAGNDLILGYSGNDVITGGGGADCIQGGPGDDTMKGGYGADQLFGEGGDDTLNAGPDADRVSGGPGRDSVLAKTGNDVVLVAAGDVPSAQTETIDGGATPGTDTLRLGRDIGAGHVVGAPPSFSVVDPATGGTYRVTEVEVIKDAP